MTQQVFSAGPRSRHLLVVLLATVTVAVTALGDGMALKGKDWSSLFLAREDEQVAFIHHADGMQHMLLSVALEAADEEHLLWIVPVPAPAEAVRIDIADSLPRLWGADPQREAEDRVDELWTAVRAWTIVPLCFEALLPSLSISRDQLVIGAEVERFGLRAEVVTTESVDALCDHFRTSNVHATSEQLAALAPYLDGKQALVIARVASLKELLHVMQEEKRLGGRRRPCVRIDFPTPQPYFPLRASRTDADQGIGLRLYVTGIVRPRSQATFVQKAFVHVYEQSEGRRELAEFVEAGLMPRPPYYYTRFSAHPKARELTDDLWFDPVSDAHLVHVKAVEVFLVRHGKWLWLPLVTLLCYTSGGLAGLLLVRKWRRPALVGLWGVLTIVGLMVRLHWVRFATPGTPGPWRPADYWTEYRLRRAFALLFATCFIVQSIVLQVACHAWLGGA